MGGTLDDHGDQKVERETGYRRILGAPMGS